LTFQLTRSFLVLSYFTLKITRG